MRCRCPLNDPASGGRARRPRSAARRRLEQDLDIDPHLWYTLRTYAKIWVYKCNSELAGGHGGGSKDTSSLDSEAPKIT
jgi:hypothetical protein